MSKKTGLSGVVNTLFGGMSRPPSAAAPRPAPSAPQGPSVGGPT